MSYSLKDITVQRDRLTPRLVNEYVQKYGVCLIPSFLDTSRLAEIQKEFLDIMSNYDSSHTFSINESKMARMPAAEFARHPQIQRLSKEELFNEITTLFYDPYPAQIVSAYIHRDQNRIEINNTWHQDPSTGMKFYFYLNDVTVKNGSFWYNIGSHREGFLRVLYERKRGNNHPTFALPENEILNPVALEAPAGSLIVFNPHGAHRAGDIENSMHRDVLRLHTEAQSAWSMKDRILQKFSRGTRNRKQVEHLCMFNKAHQTNYYEFQAPEAARPKEY